MGKTDSRFSSATENSGFIEAPKFGFVWRRIAFAAARSFHPASGGGASGLRRDIETGPGGYCPLKIRRAVGSVRDATSLLISKGPQIAIQDKKSANWPAEKFARVA